MPDSVPTRRHLPPEALDLLQALLSMQSKITIGDHGKQSARSEILALAFGSNSLAPFSVLSTNGTNLAW